MLLFRKTYDDYYFRMANASIIRKNEIRKMVNFILAHKNGGDLLEIGCGDGLLSGALKSSFRVCSTDLSESAIRMTSRHIEPGSLRLLDIERDEIQGSYDVIVALNVLEHLKDPIKALTKVKSALNKGGIFVFSAPNNYGFYGSAATMLMNFFDRTHISTYRRTAWLQIFEELGFRQITLINGTFLGLIKRNFGKHLSSTFIMVLGLKE